VRSIANGKNIEVFEIPLLAFNLLEYPVPFAAASMKSLVHYNYKNDLKVSFAGLSNYSTR
jgi:hypothetical protein